MESQNVEMPGHCALIDSQKWMWTIQQREKKIRKHFTELKFINFTTVNCEPLCQTN